MNLIEQNLLKPHSKQVGVPNLHMTPYVETVYLIDDRKEDLWVVSRLCENAGMKVRAFESPVRFLDSVTDASYGCLVVDLRMPEMSGLQLFETLSKRGIKMSTVILSGYGDVGTCRAAFKSGVFDFVEKGLTSEELLSLIRRALAHNRREVLMAYELELRRDRFASLTEREIEVTRYLAQGLSLKEIATVLNISPQTASKHRASIFTKMAVENEVQLHQVCQEFQNGVERLS